MRQLTYTTGTKKGVPFILCLDCGVISYHPADISEKYCANCKMFHTQKMAIHAMFGGRLAT